MRIMCAQDDALAADCQPPLGGGGGGACVYMSTDRLDVGDECHQRAAQG